MKENKNCSQWKRLIVPFLLTLTFQFVKAQKTYSPSPNSIALGEYANMHFSNLSTGSNSVNIPITTLSTTNFNLPITLIYNGGGVKADSKASWVGTGWALNAGGLITRTVVGHPDDAVVDGTRNKTGYLNATLAGHVHNFNTGASETSLYDAFEVYDSLYDTEPDVFYFNFVNITGTFVFDHNQTPKIISGYQNLRIEYERSSSDQRLIKFIVTDVSGNKYYFESIETSFPRSYITIYNNESGSNQSFNGEIYRSSWYLSKIITNKFEEIIFEYQNEELLYSETSSQLALGCLNNSCTDFRANSYGPGYLAVNSILYSVITPRLTSISTPTQIVSFDANSSRLDLPGGHALDEIKVYSRINSETNTPLLISKTTFTYQYTGLTGTSQPYFKYRLFLSEVQTFSGQNNSLSANPYKFNYFSNTQFDLWSITTSQDFWGYYNGIANPHLIPKIYVYPNKNIDERYSVYLDNSSTYFTLCGVDRTPNFSYAKLGTLSKIEYPDGGWTEFEYELHTFIYKGVQHEGGGLRIKKIKTYDNFNSQNPLVTEYSYNNGNVSSGEILNFPNFVFNINSSLISSLDNSSSCGTLNYYINHVEARSFTSGGLGLNNGSNVIYNKVTEILGNNGRTVYSFSSPATYGNINDCGIGTSSGCECNPAMDGYCDGLFVTPQTNYARHPTDQSTNINYSCTGIGGYNYPYAPTPDYGWNRGLLLSSISYDQNNNPVKKIESTYDLRHIGSSEKIYGLRYTKAMNGDNLHGTEVYMNFIEYSYYWLFSKYFYLTGYTKVLSSTTETLYDQDPNYHNSIVTTTNYYYENDNLLAPTKVVTINSDGTELIKKTKYCSQYDISSVSGDEALAIKEMADRHILGVPIEEVTLTKVPGENEKVLGAVLSTFKIYDIEGTSTAKMILPYENFIFLPSSPLSSFTFSNINSSNHTFWKNSSYKRTLKYDLYDANGNVLQATPENNTPVSSKYNYSALRFNMAQPLLKVASFINAKTSNIELGNECSYSGFEEATSGEDDIGINLDDFWNVYPTLVNNNLHHTGIYSREVPAASSGTVTTIKRNFKPDNQYQKFVFSCWVKTEENFETNNGKLVMLITNDDGEALNSITGYLTETPLIRSTEWKYVEAVVDLGKLRNDNPQSLNFDVRISCYIVNEDESNKFYVDDVMFRPYNSVFSYQTYHPVFGTVTSSTDEHNLTVYTEYDDFGRPVWSRDFKGNRLSHTTYVQQNPSTTGDYSYVQTDRFLNANQSSSYSLPSHGNIISSRTYVDGLGRTLQSVALYASPTYNDIISPVVYDALGRQPRTYLPFAASDNNNGGAFRSDALDQQADFYHEAQRIARAVNPWYDHRIERSNLSRLLEKSAPGYDFRMENGHTLLYQYRTNTCDDQVLHWIYNSSTQRWEATELYSAGTLFVEEGRDENYRWILVFKDKSGRHICTYTQRSDATAANATSFKNQHPLFDYSIYSVTYSIYDDFGNLIITIDPQAMNYMSSNGFNLTSTLLTHHATTYTYDNKRRLITKDAGKESEEEYVYDKLDRVVLSRDKHLATGIWKFRKYDVLGREIMTGVYDGGSSSRTTLQAYADAADYIYEKRSASNYSTNQGYSNQAFPTHDMAKVLSISHYDDYDFDCDGDQDEVSIPNSSSGVRTSNQLTATKIRTISYTNAINSTWLNSSVYYDEYGRITTAKSENHKGGNDVVTNTYAFAGYLTQTKREHKLTASSSVVTITQDFTYDHMLRPLKTLHKINSGSQVILSSVSYNELGQAYEKNLHSTNLTTPAYLQSVDFAYNARGWLTHINKADLGNDNSGFSWNNYATINSIGAHANLQAYSFGSTTVPNTEFEATANAAAGKVGQAVRVHMANNGGPVDFNNPVFIGELMSEKVITWLESQYDSRYAFERAIRVSLPCGITEYSDNYTNDPNTYTDALYAAYPNRTILKYKLRKFLTDAFTNIINNQSLDRTSANTAAVTVVNTFFSDVVNELLGTSYSISSTVYKLPNENSTYSDCYFAESYDYYNTYNIGSSMSQQVFLHLLGGQYNPSTMETHLAGVMPSNLDAYGDLSEAYIDPEYNDFPYKTLARYILRNMIKMELDAFIAESNIPRCTSTNNIADDVIADFKSTFFSSNTIPTSVYRLSCPTASQNNYYYYTSSQFTDNLANDMVNRLNSLGSSATVQAVNDELDDAVAAYNPSSCSFNSWITIPGPVYHITLPTSSAFSSEAIAAMSMDVAKHTLGLLERDGYDETHFATASFQGIHLTQAQSDPEYAERPNATKLLHELAGSIETALTALGTSATEANYRGAMNTAVNGLVAYAFTSPLTGGKLIFNDDNNDLFGMELKYNYSLAAKYKQYNGNISAMHWKVAGSGQQQHTYAFSYDALNQLTGAEYYAISSASAQAGVGNYNEALTYDLNGNIKTLKRRGLKTTATASYDLVDDLIYKYSDSDRGNKLLAVDDAAASADMTNDFTEGSSYSSGYSSVVEATTSTHEYLYKADGSLQQDKNKGISDINYNYLNLPAEISFTSGAKIRFLYAADGTKLAQTVIPVSGPSLTNDYVDGFVYETPSNTNTTTLKFFAHAQGRVTLNGSNYEYEYIITDHLGNARVSFRDNNGTAQIIQHNAYYPFGLSNADPVMHYVNGQENFFTYTGKEIISAEGLEWYDYGWRMYDAQLARWHCPDPEDVHWSTYLALANNPITTIDPDGRFPFFTVAIVAIYVMQDVERESQKNDPNYFKAVALGALKGTVAAISGSPENIILSMITDQLPGIDIPLNKNVSLTVRPSFAYSSYGSLGIGPKVSMNYTQGDMTYTASFTPRFGAKGKLLETRTGIGATYHSSADGDFSLSFVHFGVKDPQNTWTARWKKNGLSLGASEDYFFGDEYRTFAAEIGSGDYVVGTSLYTNDPGPNAVKKGPEFFTSRVAGRNRKGTYIEGKRIYSNFYLGIKDGNNVYRFGVESPWVQDIFQNGFHRIGSNTAFFPTDYNSPTLPYYYYGTYDPMSIY